MTEIQGDMVIFCLPLIVGALWSIAFNFAVLAPYAVGEPERGQWWT